MLAAVVAGLTGLSYAELSSFIPRAGGEYHYAQRAFGHLVAFLTTWLLLDRESVWNKLSNDQKKIILTVAKKSLADSFAAAKLGRYPQALTLTHPPSC